MCQLNLASFVKEWVSCQSLVSKASYWLGQPPILTQPLSPLSLETSLVKYIGMRCKIRTYKPIEQECMDFSFVAKNLPWLADFEREAELNNAYLLPNYVLCGTQDILSSSAQVKNEISFPTEWPFVIDSFELPYKSHNANLNFTTVGTQKCPFFIHFIFRYSSHFIVPLTFYHTISIHICGFHLIISTLFILVL